MRLLSLDVYRGLTIAGMILVTDPGTYSAVYWPLRHAEWQGWTINDMIFPSFLFIVGVAMNLSFASRTARGETRGQLARQLLTRAVLLIALGLFLNAFPLFHLDTVRIPGILQRIALCSVLGGMLYLALLPVSEREGDSTARKRVWTLTAVSAGILLGYALLLRYCPVPGFGPNRHDSLGSLPAFLDRVIFPIRHMWPYGTTPGYGVTFDPEGLLSTLPATVNLLIGLLAGEYLRTRHTGARKAALFALAGIILFVVGMALGPWVPIVKKIWTSSFALLSVGFSLMALALSYWVLDVRRWRGWTRPLTLPGVVFGTNAILAFALSTVITTLLDLVQARPSLSLHHWLHQTLFLPWLSPANSSLAYALCIVAINLAIVGVFYRNKIFLRL
jgi:predicted acyltransferase